MNVFKEMGCSVAKVSAYPKFLKNRKGKVFGYGVLLLLFYFIIAYMIPAIAFQVRTGGFGKILEENVPDFELKDGTLWVEEPIYYDSGSVYTDIDTDMYFDVDSAYDFSYGYTSVIIMDAEKMFVKSNGQVQYFYYSDLDDLNLSRDSLKSWVPMIYVIVIITGIVMYVCQVALFFFALLFIALIGLIFNSILKARMTFGQVYLLAIYSRTLPLAIKAVVKLIGITIPFFWVINYGISLVYLFLALKQVNKQQAPTGGPYVYGGTYGQESGYGQESSYGQGDAYGQGSGYGQGDAYGQGSGYGQGDTYSQGNGYGQNDDSRGF